MTLQADVPAESLHPILNEHPKTLTKEQIRHFNEFGFIDNLRLFDSTEASEHRHRFDALLSEFQKRSRDAYAINGYHSRIDFIWDIATHPVLLDHIEDLIGPNIVLWGSHYFCKLPSDVREVPFHQDATYWPFRPFKTVTVWLAVDDVDANMGPMCFLSCSHIRGKMATRNRDDDVVLHLEVVDRAELDKPYPLLMKAGQFSLHTDLLVHGSAVNESPKRRAGLTLRYVPPDVRLADEKFRNWIRNAIVCRGCDISDYWPYNPRPSSWVLD